VGNIEFPAFTVVQNSYLAPTDKERMFQIHFYTNKPELVELGISQGVWEITKDCEWKAEFGGDGYEDCKYSQIVKWEKQVFLKPFDKVLLADDSDFNLIEGISDPDRKVPVVPVILLYYAKEKGELANIKSYVQNTLDVVTLLVPVTKIVTGPKWLAKTFTFVDKWSKVNAGANLAVNNSSLHKIPELKATLDAYNAVTAAMNITSLAGAIGKAPIAKFFKELDNPAAKQALLNQAKKGNNDAKKILDVEAELKTYSEAKLGKNWWKSSDEVVGNVADNIFDLVKFRNLSEIRPTGRNLTNLRKKEFIEYGYKIKPTSSGLKTKIDDIIANGDNFGVKTEGIVDDIMKENGFMVIDGKYGSNNGFDGVYIKGSVENPTEIIIVESKQFKYTNGVADGIIEHNGVTLNPPSGNTPLPAQMSDEWIQYVADKLSKNTNTEVLGDKILEIMNFDRNRISKYVSAINKTTGEINFLKLGQY
jgi:hypothetical protein